MVQLLVAHGADPTKVSFLLLLLVELYWILHILVGFVSYIRLLYFVGPDAKHSGVCSLLTVLFELLFSLFPVCV